MERLSWQPEPYAGSQSPVIHWGSAARCVAATVGRNQSS
jgi:hypothetical protein